MMRMSSTRVGARSQACPQTYATVLHVRPSGRLAHAHARRPLPGAAVVAHASRSVRLVDHPAAQSGPDLNVEVHGSEQGVAAALVEAVEVAATHAIADKGFFTLAVPGGSVLKMLSGLAASSAGIDWSKVHMAYVNHKCVPVDDKSSTHHKAKGYFLDAVRVPASNVLAVHGSSDAKAEAEAYEAALKGLASRLAMPTRASGAPVFDLMLIGMGADGHVGSLYPGKPATTQTEGWVLPVVKAEGASSITLSHPVMGAAKHVVICVTGAKKAPTVRQALEERLPPGALPAQMIRAEAGSKVVWLMDAEAGAELQGVKGLQAVVLPGSA